MDSPLVVRPSLLDTVTQTHWTLDIDTEQGQCRCQGVPGIDREQGRCRCQGVPGMLITISASVAFLPGWLVTIQFPCLLFSLQVQSQLLLLWRSLIARQSFTCSLLLQTPSLRPSLGLHHTFSACRNTLLCLHLQNRCAHGLA